MITLNRCIEVAGGDRVGRFLYRLHHWTNFTRIVRGGVKWVALTYAQWAEELAVSYTQFKYLLEKAAAAGQVVREQHRFRGLKVLFVRLSDDTRAAIAQTDMGKSAQTDVGKSAQLIRNSNQEPIEETKIAGGRPAAAAPAPTQASKPTPTPIIVTTPTTPTATPTATTTTKVETLEALWRQARRSAPITKKMRGQFRHLVRTLRAGEAERAVRFALAHWPRLVRAAEKRHGAFRSPDTPHLGFLVKHIEAVRSLMNKPPPPAEPSEGWALRDAPPKREGYFARHGAPQGEGFVRAARRYPSVILSAAKDLMTVASGDEILRCAQDDRRSSACARPAIMTWREMLALDGAALEGVAA